MSGYRAATEEGIGGNVIGDPVSELKRMDSEGAFGGGSLRFGRGNAERGFRITVQKVPRGQSVSPGRGVQLVMEGDPVSLRGCCPA